MTKVFPLVEAKVRATFSPQEAEIAISAFSNMKEPPPEGQWLTTRARVQTAIFISSQSSLKTLLENIANSQMDWRDVLMCSGLGESNWRDVAENAGFHFVEI